MREGATPAKCTICGKSTADTPARLRPFCSKRCADIDLGRWFSGGYVLPGKPVELDEDAPANNDEP